MALLHCRFLNKVYNSKAGTWSGNSGQIVHFFGRSGLFCILMGYYSDLGRKSRKDVESILEVNNLGISKTSLYPDEMKGGSLMVIRDKFTENIIVSSLKTLKIEHGWNEQLVSKIMELHNSNALNNLQSLSMAFEEVAVSTEVEDSD